MCLYAFRVSKVHLNECTKYIPHWRSMSNRYLRCCCGSSNVNPGKTCNSKINFGSWKTEENWCYHQGGNPIHSLEWPFGTQKAYRKGLGKTAKSGTWKNGDPTPLYTLKKKIGLCSISPAPHLRSSLAPFSVCCFPWMAPGKHQECFQKHFQNYQTAQIKTSCSNLAKLY